MRILANVELFTIWRFKAVTKSILWGFEHLLEAFELLSAKAIWVCCFIGRKRTIVLMESVAQHLVIPFSDCQFISIIADVLIFIPNLIEARSRGVVLFVCACMAATVLWSRYTMTPACIVYLLIAIKINYRNIPHFILTIDYFQYRVFPSSYLFGVHTTQWCIKIVCQLTDRRLKIYTKNAHAARFFPLISLVVSTGLSHRRWQSSLTISTDLINKHQCHAIIYDK